MSNPSPLRRLKLPGVEIVVPLLAIWFLLWTASPVSAASLQEVRELLTQGHYLAANEKAIEVLQSDGEQTDALIAFSRSAAGIG